MATWTDLTSTELGVDTIIKSTTGFALYNNVTAAFEKASGAPQLATDYIVTAMIANSQVTEGKIGSSAVSQAKLKTSSGEISTTSNTTGTLPGGAYGFYPQVRRSPSGNAFARIAGDSAVIGASNETRMFISTPSGTIFGIQRYVTASPPYNLGDGEIPLFVFAAVHSGGQIAATWVAPDPPWANNGPTDIRPQLVDRQGRAFKFERPRIDGAKLRDPLTRDGELSKLDMPPQLVEITNAVKNADMPLIPQPFHEIAEVSGAPIPGLTIVLLDPVGSVTERLLRLHTEGESVGELMNESYIQLDNVPLIRQAPPGVMPVAPSWKVT